MLVFLFDIRRTGGRIGAEVTGADLSTDLPDSVVRRIHEAFPARRFEAAHPVVRVHPESGEPSLFLGGFAQWLVGVEPRESRPVLDVLQGYVRRPENTARWSWRPGDVLIFDNRSTQHYAVDDYGRRQRVLHRVSVTGDVPFGLDGRRSHALKEGD
ncbi:TauD/TfdA dioxygenase family protein [Streptomyces caelestis]|uniref:TauD/TfdA dioxygenase family protein n=1 Tax=Streptomyces caelestis TaxID=36816 RepID=UPI00365A71F2